ncbi:FBP domain-containing protein [Streptomyces sp. NPDC057144]|uniref:FBP domain-containing protein n=1 Tax=Streptomyces TaxID=1883 RepID=UPI0018D8CDD6|nr:MULTISPECIES: FBP domain-containing protein [Streptomyces]MBH5132576.1 FBP domain-containing protein [Streptomyces sp. HB-N217]WSU04030.1 FBP domain-containing protein [Streptomyces sp. NBC_01124]
MKPLTEHDIRTSFVNCSKGAAERLPLPKDLADLDHWDDLDFLGWSDLSAPDRSYLVLERAAGPVGLTLRSASGNRGFLRRSMCSLCLTTHPGGGVCLVSAPKAGPAGRDGNSVGLYVCADLDCSLYVRGKKKAAPGGRMEESLTVEQQIERLRGNLDAFVERILH